MALGGSQVVATHLRVTLGPQDVGMTRVRGVDSHVSRCFHICASVDEIGFGNFAQPAKVNQVKGRPLTVGVDVVSFSNTLGIGTSVEFVGHAVATIIIVGLSCVALQGRAVGEGRVAL